jgi:hypothetical protein
LTLFLDFIRLACTQEVVQMMDSDTETWQDICWDGDESKSAEDAEDGEEWEEEDPMEWGDEAWNEEEWDETFDPDHKSGKGGKSEKQENEKRKEKKVKEEAAVLKNGVAISWQERVGKRRVENLMSKL